jgi:hypothetical protein
MKYYISLVQIYFIKIYLHTLNDKHRNRGQSSQNLRSNSTIREEGNTAMNKLCHR